MTTDPEPLSAEEEAELRSWVRYQPPSNERWFERLLATLDEARATPSGDLAAAAQAVVDEADFHRMDLTPLWERITDLRVALRSVSADSTAGLDRAKRTHDETHGEPEQCGPECLPFLSDTSGDTA